MNRIYDLPGKCKSMPRVGRLLREGTFVAHERCPSRRRRRRLRHRGPLILLSPYKFRATKTLCIFISDPGTRKRKRDITSAISCGNTRAVWPDRVTIRTRDIHLKRHRFINQSSLSAIARTSTHPSRSDRRYSPIFALYRNCFSTLLCNEIIGNRSSQILFLHRPYESTSRNL